jgi:DNA-binding NtrC family response regulator
MISRIARSSLPVLVQGPTGAGKELVAQAIHTASGRAGPWVAFNVCALPEGTLEGALFGHVRGGFTGAVSDTPGYLAEADGGTVFFDEIDGLAFPLQRKLLRSIETRQFRPVGGRHDRRSDFRVVAASNAELEALAEQGLFRSDLLFRLRGALVRVPALAAHAEDIPELACCFLAPCINGRGHLQLTQEAMSTLQAYSWPGNVRQLRFAIEYAATLADGEWIGNDDVLAALGHMDGGTELAERAVNPTRRRFIALLDRVGWDTAAAAQIERIHRATVYRRMQRMGISPPRRRAGFAVTRANSQTFAANSPTLNA